MPRYIDADALLERFDAEEPMNWNDTEAEVQEHAAFMFYRWLVDSAPTADVVPRAEVDEIAEELSDTIIMKDELFDEVVKLRAEVEDWQAIAEGYQQMLESQYEMHQAELAETKAEVAREIFAEIEREIKNHGITYAQRKIAELKKKYTEGGERNGGCQMDKNSDGCL